MTTPTVPDFGEPIVVSPATDSVIRDRDGMTVGAVMPSSRVPISRIIACVNACQGIPTDRLRPGSVKRLVEAAASAMQHVRRTEWAEHIDCSFADNLWSALSPFQEPAQ